MDYIWDRVDKAVAAMGWPAFTGMPEPAWQEALAIKLEETKAKIDRLEALADQVDAMLSMAKRKYQTVVDDGDYWEISDDVFQEVQKAFDEIKTAQAEDPS